METIATNLLIMGCGLLTSVLISRSLGSAGRGQLAAAILWPPMLVYLTHAGFLQAILYFASRQRKDIPKIFVMALVLVPFAAVCLTVTGYLLLPFVLGQQPPDTIYIARVYLILIPLLIISEVISAILQSQLHMTYWNMLRLLTPIGYCSGVAVLNAFDKLTVDRVVLLLLCLAAIRCVVALFSVPIFKLKVKGSVDWPFVKTIGRYSVSAHPGSVSQFGAGQTDMLLLAALLSSHELGIYVVAANTSRILMAFPTALRSNMMPQVAAQEDQASQSYIITKTLASYLGITMILLPPLALVFIHAIPLVYGSDFREAVLPSLILLVATAATGGREIMAGGARAANLPWLSSKAELSSVLLTALGAISVLPWFGLIGIAVVSVLANVYSLALLLNSPLFDLQWLKLRFRTYVPRDV